MTIPLCRWLSDFNTLTHAHLMAAVLANKIFTNIIFVFFFISCSFRWSRRWNEWFVQNSFINVMERFFVCIFCAKCTAIGHLDMSHWIFQNTRTARSLVWCTHTSTSADCVVCSMNCVHSSVCAVVLDKPANFAVSDLCTVAEWNDVIFSAFGLSVIESHDSRRKTCTV